MAEVNAKDLTTKTAPASTDSMLLFGTTSNEGAKITVDNLADNILSRLTTKTFANQVGGSSAATILAQLATLNSNIAYEEKSYKYSTYIKNYTVRKFGRVVWFNSTGDLMEFPQGTTTLFTLDEQFRPVSTTRVRFDTGDVNFRLTVSSDGTVQFYTPVAISSANNGAISCMWMTAN